MLIAIPSYQRPEKLLRYTLAFLKSEKVKSDIITIFVANQKEYEEYREVIPADYKIVVGRKGISQQRLFIRNYFPENQKIVCLDDDIRKIKYLRTELNFKLLCDRMFAYCEQESLSTWGIYPVNNLFFCKDRVLKGRFYIIGCCYGYINKHDIQDWLPEKGTKEDFWYSLDRISKEGAVLRYDGACPDTIYYAKGGLSEVRTKEVEETEAKQIANMFPAFCTLHHKKNGHTDPKIKRLVMDEFPIFSTIECPDTTKQDTSSEKPKSNAAKPS